MTKIILFSLCLFPCIAFGQLWVDTSYTIQTDTNIVYGTAIDFAGAEQSLQLDISYPLDDSPPVCGRPLMVIVHGGGWVAGDKAEDYPPALRRDFAKRGYVTASVNYRLGQFHTDRMINCNVPGWNCINMTDSSEWYRANYRGMQDVNGAIRYIVNHASDYNIDATNVFVVGESAGGFIAMGVGFLDDETEVLDSLIMEYPDAPPPNQIYETPCIKNFGLAADIDSMDLSRPDLGSYVGTLNLPADEYTIKGVGNFYGGAFNNIFQSSSDVIPALYMYHQPCDLVVPYNYSRLFAGYVNCLLGFPTNCGYPINRPLAYGSRGIKILLDTMIANGIPSPDYYFDNTTNNFNCIQQINQSCHSIDAYWLRTTNMATFFAEKIDCIVPSNESSTAVHSIRMYPNPSHAITTFDLQSPHAQVEVQVLDLLGQVQLVAHFTNTRSFDLDVSQLAKGVYIVHLKINQEKYTSVKLIVQ